MPPSQSLSIESQISAAEVLIAAEASSQSVLSATVPVGWVHVT